MATSPSEATVLWIEADPVFGGSRSQVQFAAELAPFFNLPGGPRIGDFVERSVCYSGVEYAPKKMDFHHNDVWRLNLPTAAQGLGRYEGMILVFRRASRPDVFDLWIIEPDAPEHDMLRSSCRREGFIGQRQRDDGSHRAFGYY
jgi:hypothetical protein